MFQGTLLKRHKIAKRSVGGEPEYFEWNDFLVGTEVTIYGRCVSVNASLYCELELPMICGFVGFAGRTGS